jgi:hypothetical protein
LESAQKCVTTYLPNELVLKMDCGNSDFFKRRTTIRLNYLGLFSKSNE